MAKYGNPEAKRHGHNKVGDTVGRKHGTKSYPAGTQINKIVTDIRQPVDERRDLPVMGVFYPKGQMQKIASEHPAQIVRPFYEQAARAMKMEGGPNMVAAQIFNYSAQATKFAAVLSTRYMDVLQRMMHDIRLPFPVTVLEYDNYAMLEWCDKWATEYRTKLGHPTPERNNDDMPKRIAVLCWHPVPELPTIHIWPQMIGETGESFTVPFMFRFEPEEEIKTNPIIRILVEKALERQHRYVPLTDEQMAALGLEDREQLICNRITLAMRCIPGVENKTVGEIARHISIVPSPTTRFSMNAMKNDNMRDMFLDLMAIQLQETAGNALHAIAMLAMLDMRDKITSYPSDMVRQKGRIGLGTKHSTPYLVERDVKIILPERLHKAALRRFVRETYRKKRHPVRAHWCQKHNSGDPSCIHVWEQLDPSHYNCKKCGRRRFRKPAHERGDARLGYVRRSEFKVEIDKDNP